MHVIIMNKCFNIISDNVKCFIFIGNNATPNIIQVAGVNYFAPPPKYDRKFVGMQYI